MNILVIKEKQSAAPNMAALISDAVIEAFSDKGENVVSLIQDDLSDEDNREWVFNYLKYIKDSRSNEIRLSSKLFQPYSRHLLTQVIEQIIFDLNIDFIVAFGIVRCGYSACIASYLCSNRCKIMLVANWHDVFVGQLNDFEILNQSITKANFICTLNQEMTHRLKILYNKDIQSITSQAHLDRILRQYTHKMPETSPTMLAEKYVVSSGQLNSVCNFYDLTQRVASIIRDTNLKWIHLGDVSEKIMADFYLKVFQAGISDQLIIKTNFSEIDYWYHIDNAQGLIHVFGVDEGNVKFYLSDMIGVPCYYSYETPLTNKEEVIELDEYLERVI